jgi:CRP/FNR family transcriptional regulator, cyclic AMP receptor protein
MEELDFTKPQPAVSPPSSPAPSPSAPFKPAASRFYDRAIAQKVFSLAGRAERFPAGATLFSEDDKATSGGLFSRGPATRMYFVAEGQVAVSAGGRILDTLGAGEVIGEMAVLTEQPRSATAIAKTDCAAYSMSAEEFKGALGRVPEFALMLLSVMFDRLRFVTARLAARHIPVAARPGEPPVFDPVLLGRLEAALPRSAVARYWADSVIMREGQAGAYMYVVKAGTVAIAVRDHVVAVVNPGGTFGEMALVDQSARSATAVAQTECELLSIDRACLMEAVKAQPAFAIAMLHAFAGRLRHMNAQVA